ncbi:MAG: class I SAM-dependent methyltransferase [Bacteroidales bacterium]|nr:class I SAM-dependent methyltransferase [Bacteroidales bacterium]MCF8404144.1 class I SAM-dependent methyltransferase [Bacteroidales bacterium]
MDCEYEQIYHSVELEHWWFVARRETIYSFLKKYSKKSMVLDIGCSSGLLLSGIRDEGFFLENLYGIDISEKAIRNCKVNGIQNAFVMDAEKIEFRDKKFDIIIASDCLEHLQNDRNALENWYSLLNDDGIAIIFVPAFSFLWSHHDVVNKHVKRYTRSELTKLINNANFAIVKSGYWNFLFFFPAFMIRKLNTILLKISSKKENDKTGDLFLPPKNVNKVLIKLLKLETRLIAKIRFPFGVSTFAIGKK